MYVQAGMYRLAKARLAKRPSPMRPTPSFPYYRTI